VSWLILALLSLVAGAAVGAALVLRAERERSWREYQEKRWQDLQERWRQQNRW